MIQYLVNRFLSVFVHDSDMVEPVSATFGGPRRLTPGEGRNPKARKKTQVLTEF